MKTLQDAIYSHLTTANYSDNQVYRIVADNVIPLHSLASSTPPYIVYETTNLNIDECLDGTFSEIQEESIIFHCVADSYTQAKELSRALFNRLKTVKGIYTDREILCHSHDAEAEDSVYDETGNDTGNRVVSTSFTFLHRQIEES